MSVWTSCLYECTVMHRRLHPRHHQFTYRIFLFYLDLDELTLLAKQIPIFSFNEPNLYSLHNEDYFQLEAGSIRKNVLTFLKSEGFSRTPARIRLLTLPRLLGYTFNPISIFYCFDEKERPMVSVIQVGNTFGELKPFVIPFISNTRGFHRHVPKDFYVSPFSDLDLHFNFRLGMPGTRLKVMIDDYASSQKVLVSTLVGSRVALTFSHLVKFTLKYPFITAKVVALIHFEAMRLWLKGIPYRLKEAHPELQRSVFSGRENSPV